MYGIAVSDLRRYVIAPALQRLHLFSEDAMELLVATAAAESLGGRYLKQMKDGPACGIFQMEPATHTDIWENFLAYRPMLRSLIGRDAPDNHERLITDLTYAAMMCRIHYLRVPEPLPDKSDHQAMASYWKEHYNTRQGKGTEAEFIKHYRAYLASR